MKPRLGGTHEDYARAHDVAGPSNRSFGRVMAAFFALVALAPLLRHGHLRSWALMVAVAFLATSWLVPIALGPLNWVWLRLGLLLHLIVSPVSLAVLFFVVFAPFAIVLRALGHDFLRRRKTPQ